MTSPDVAALPAHGWRTFVWLWASQSLSVILSGVSGFASSVYIAQTLYPRPDQQAQLSLGLTALFLISGLGAVLLAPHAGSWADRRDRRTTMIGADVLNGLATLLLALAVLSGHGPLWLVLAVAALQILAETYHGSALETSYAMLLPDARLGRANAMMQTSLQAARLFAPAVGSLVIALPVWLRGAGVLGGLHDGVGLVFVLDGLSFLLAALVMARLAVPSPVQGEATASQGVVHDTRLGWDYIRRRPPLLALLVVLAFLNFSAAPMNLYEPLIANFNLAASFRGLGLDFASGLAVVSSATALGAFVGGLVISGWGGLTTRRIRGVLWPVLVFAAMVGVVGFSRSLPLTAAALFVFGLMFPAIGAHSGAIWMTLVPREIQGRVFSVRRLVSKFTIPLGTLVMGAVAARVAPGVVIGSVGLAFTALIALQFLNRGLWRVEDRAYLDGLAERAAR